MTAERGALFIFLALLVWAPFPLGSNRAWAWTILELGLFLATALWTLGWMRGRHGSLQLLRAARPAFVLLGLWLAWHFAYVVNPWLGGALSEPGVREWTGRAIVLLLVLLAGAGLLASWQARRFALAGAAVALGALVKLGPLLLVPALARRGGRWFVGVSLGVVVLGLTLVLNVIFW